MSWTAATAGLALTVLAFSQLLDVGNYNYICPYSHEEFHGIVLAVVMMACLACWLEAGRKLPLALAGVCLGLIFLTKPEVFVGAVAAVRRRHDFAVAADFNSRTGEGVIAGGSMRFVPLAGFYFGFRSEMNSTEAARAICGAWLPLLHQAASNFPFISATRAWMRPGFTSARR